MALREVTDSGILFFCEPIELAVADITATSIPVTVPDWLPDTWYPAGAMVKVGSRTFLSMLTEAATYYTDCEHLYNINQNPTDDPAPFVPIDHLTDKSQQCGYKQAGMAWWKEVDPAINYLDALLNPNVYSGAEVPGTISVTVAPKAQYDAVAVFGLRAATATLSNGDARDLTICEPDSNGFYPFGPRITHADRVVWLLAAPSTATFTLTLTPLDGLCVAGTLVVARTNVLAVTRYETTIGIIDYSRKERDAFGRAQVVPRWYQDHVRFLITVAAEDRMVVHPLLTRLRNTPCLVVGHDNPARYELQIFGLLKEVALPLENVAESLIDLDIESVGVPRLASGIPMEPIPEPPPLPDVEIPAPYLAVGHDKAPFITVVNTLTWRKVTVNFTIPGPARAVLFDSEQTYLFIGHECPPYFTVVLVENWTAIDWDYNSSGGNWSSSDGLGITLPGTVYGLALSPDGFRIALAHQCPPHLTILSVGDWIKVSDALVPLPRSLTKVTYNDDGTLMLLHDTCQHRHQLQVADLSLPLDTLLNRGRAGVYDHDGLHWLLGYGDYDLQPINRVDKMLMADKSRVARVLLPGDPYIIKYSPDGQYLAVGHRCPPYLTIIDTATFTTVETFYTLEYSICSLDFNEDGLYLAVVYKHHPYCTIIRTGQWREFHLSFLDDDSSNFAGSSGL